VDDQDASRTLARRLLVLVGPAPVICHGPAAEGIQLRLFEVGIIDQHHKDLATHVLALEVVPVPLGRADAIADEDQLGVLQANAVGRTAGRDHGLLALAQRLAPIPDGKGGDRIDHREPRQLHRLGPAAIDATGLEACSGEALAHEGDHLVLGHATDPPPLEGVVRQLANVDVQPPGVERRLGQGRRRDPQHQGGDQGQAANSGAHAQTPATELNAGL